MVVEVEVEQIPLEVVEEEYLAAAGKSLPLAVVEQSPSVPGWAEFEAKSLLNASNCPKGLARALEDRASETWTSCESP